MTARLWLRLAEIFVPVLIAATILFAWQADRRDRAQLASQLAAAQQIIAQASTNQKDRDAQLTQTLAQLTAQKQSNLTLTQLLQALPQALHLPQPFIPATPGQSAGDQNVGARFIVPSTVTPPTTAPVSNAPNREGNSSPAAVNPAAPTIDNPLPKPTASANNPAQSIPSSSNSPVAAAQANAVIPSADLKPLYDFALDCQACQAKLSAAQADLTDEKTKSAATASANNPAQSIPSSSNSPVAAAQANAVIPSADLKPLYDFALDCQACQAKLSAAQADLTDEKTKSAALTKQRDAALQPAKGGSLLRRVARAAKWFALGAAAGAVAAKAPH